MYPVSCPFNRAPISAHRYGGINHTKIKGSYEEMANENFVPGEEEVNWNQNQHVTPTSSISLKPKPSGLLNLSHYQKVHPFVKRLVKETRETFPIAGRLKYFLKNWEKVTNDSTIQGYSIDFVEIPYQPRTQIRSKLNQVQEELVSQVVGDIRETIPCKDQFLSHLFSAILVSKKEGGQRPVISLKDLNILIPYKHFKMDGHHMLEEILEQGDYSCKLDFKGAYFCVPLNKQSR